MELKSLSSSPAQQSHAKDALQEPNGNVVKKGKNTEASSKGLDKVSLSPKGVEQSSMVLKLVEQLHKMTQADPETTALAFGTLDLSKATTLLQ